MGFCGVNLGEFPGGGGTPKYVKIIVSEISTDIKKLL